MEFEANYDECYNGYVYDEAQIKKNDAFTFGQSSAVVEVPSPASAPSNKKVNALELELAETKAAQEATERRLQRESRKRDEE